MHDRLLITIMTIIALDSVFIGFTAVDVGSGILLMLITTIAFNKHLFFTFGLAVIATPVTLLIQKRMAPWTAIVLLTFDLVGTQVNRQSKKVKTNAANPEVDECENLELGLTSSPKLNSKKDFQMMF